MCYNPYYALQVKKEYDIRFQRTGVSQPLHIIGSVKTVDVSTIKYGKEHNLIMIPCGQCKECRVKKVRDKTCQGLAEFQTSKCGFMLNLTFGDVATYKTLRKKNKLNRYQAIKMTNFMKWSLEVAEFQKFMKRLRFWYYQYQLRQFLVSKGYYELAQKKSIRLSKDFKEFYKEDLSKFETIRYLHCGEYGSDYSRPHHHAIIYNLPREILECYEKPVYSAKKHRVVRQCISRVIEKLWSFGYHTIDVCNSGTIGYVSRYIVKKLNGDNKENILQGRYPEYTTASNRKCLGHDWFLKNKDELVQTEECVFMTDKGKKVRFGLPSAFDRLLKKYNHYDDYYKLKEKRCERSVNDLKNILDTGVSIYSWLNSKEIIVLQYLKKYIRSYEDEKITYDAFVTKARSFGFSDEFIYSFPENTRNYLCTKGFKDFRYHSTNDDLLEKYRKYEQYRLKNINYYKGNCMLSEKQRQSAIELFKSFINPFKCKQKGKQIMPKILTQNDDMCYIDVKGIEYVY